MSQTDALRRHLTPSQEFHLLKEYLRWRTIQSVTGKLEPIMDSQLAFAKKAGVSKALISEIVRNPAGEAFGNKWPQIVNAFGLTIENALELSREWRATPAGVRWLDECGAWDHIFPSITPGDPASVRNAMMAIDGLPDRLQPAAREEIRVKLLALEADRTESHVILSYAITQATAARIMEKLSPGLDVKHRGIAKRPKLQVRNKRDTPESK